MCGKKPEVGVGVIVMKGEEVLLIKRSNTVFGGGMWSAPVGFLKPNETFEDCAVRELNQSVGIMIVDARFIAITDCTLNGGSQNRFVTIWMQSRHINGMPFARDKSWISDTKWFKLDRKSLPPPNNIYYTLRKLLCGDSYVPHGGIDHLRKILASPLTGTNFQLSPCCEAQIETLGGPVLLRRCKKCKEPIIALPLVRGV